MRRWLLASLMLITMGPWTGAHAQSCVASASTFDFGSFDPLSQTALDTMGSIGVVCSWPSNTTTPHALVCLGLDVASPLSLNNPSSVTPNISYDLYIDAGRAQIWGVPARSGTTPLSVVLNKPASGTVQSALLTVYGRIFANQKYVATVGSTDTDYSNSFTGSQTKVSFRFYSTTPPTCAALTASGSTFPFTSTTTVVNQCNINTTNIDFGTTTGATIQPLTATGMINAQCTNQDSYSISLNGGGNNNIMNRTMLRSSGSAGPVSYQLYLDSAHTQIWGDGTGGTGVATGTGTGDFKSFTIYGVVTSQAAPQPGNYIDTITATITF